MIAFAHSPRLGNGEQQPTRTKAKAQSRKWSMVARKSVPAGGTDWRQSGMRQRYNSRWEGGFCASLAPQLIVVLLFDPQQGCRNEEGIVEELDSCDTPGTVPGVRAE